MGKAVDVLGAVTIPIHIGRLGAVTSILYRVVNTGMINFKEGFNSILSSTYFYSIVQTWVTERNVMFRISNSIRLKKVDESTQ